MFKSTIALSYFFTTVCLSYTFTLQEQPSLGLVSQFKGSELCEVAKETQKYLTNYSDDEFAVQAGRVFSDEVTLARVDKTLEFVCKTYREDVRNKQQSRLHDNDFLKQYFDFYRWTPDKNTANELAKKSTNKIKSRLLKQIPAKEILLTKYYTKLLTGSSVRTDTFNQALYALPFDEQEFSMEQADQRKQQLTRFKYTRQDIINGVLLEQNLAQPLVWMTEEALHDVLLQGTGVLNVDGKTRYFNVHRNNGIQYDYAIGKREQARYWYFAEVPSIMGYGETLQSKIAIKPHVTFAGNVADLGLGKLLVVSYSYQGKQVSRLGILADQGGAFDNNLFQLDLLVDSYQGWSDYYQANKGLPDYAKAWMVLLKD